MKRILTVQDISCVGKCSLTVALPIISAMGIEASILPTAVLSTHTAFSEFTLCDLTDEMEKIADSWERQGIDFDAIYTGYLASTRQIDIVCDIFERFGKGKLKLVDPAMADNGKLYCGFSDDFPKYMAKLCSKADVIIPNLTEACFLLGVPYPDGAYTEEYIKELLKGLTELGCKCAVITGVKLNENSLGFFGYNSESDEFFSYFRPELKEHFHGTGDVFASICFSSLVNGESLLCACKRAADFVCDSIVSTLNDDRPITYGVHFEKVLSAKQK